MSRREGVIARSHSGHTAVAAPPARAPRAWLAAGLAVALTVATLWVYAPVRGYDFVELDDPLYVRENPHVTAGLSADSVRWAFTSLHAGYWIPLTWTSYMVDVEVYGSADPRGFHVTNLLLHLANTLLLFGLLRSMTRAPVPSAFVAALFALHPLHVESVAWITERKDVLSTMFWFLGLWAYASYIARPHWRRYTLVVVCAVLGLLAKPMVVTFPFVLLLLDVWPLKRVTLYGTGAWPAWRRAILEKLPLVALAVGAGVLTYLAQDQAGAAATLEAVPAGLRLQNAVVSYVAYLWATVWPSPLAAIYPIAPGIPLWKVAGAGVLLAAVTALVLRAAKHRPYLPVGWFWYLGTLLPVSGLLQVGVQARADRFTYVPLIGVFIMGAWAAADAAAKSRALRRATAVVALAVVGAAALQARQQVAYWQDSVALWTHALETTLGMNRYDAHLALGRILAGKGRYRRGPRTLRGSARVEPGLEGAEVRHRKSPGAAREAGGGDPAPSGALPGSARHVRGARPACRTSGRERTARRRGPGVSRGGSPEAGTRSRAQQPGGAAGFARQVRGGDSAVRGGGAPGARRRDGAGEPGTRLVEAGTGCGRTRRVHRGPAAEPPQRRRARGDRGTLWPVRRERRYSWGVRGLQLSVLLVVAVMLVLPAGSSRLAGQVFKSGVDLVIVQATVKDRDGRLVSGLGIDDFRIFEDGVEQRVLQFTGERVPVSLGIAVDVSDSMFGVRIADARRAIDRFVLSLLDEGDEAFLMVFNHMPLIRAPWTRPPRGLAGRLDNVKPFGGTAIYDALIKAVPMFDKRRHERCGLLVISDGADTASDARLQDALRQVNYSDAFVYAIALDAPSGPAINRGFSPEALNDITSQSGGYTEVIRDSAELPAATERIASELNHQYTLAYAPSRQPDGKYHTIRVRATHEQYIVRSRRGFTHQRRAPGQSR